jgi:hypothetical protein
MSRFASAKGVKAHLDVYSAISGIAALVMILGAVYMVFHNMEHGSADGRGEAPTPFEIIESH